MKQHEKPFPKLAVNQTCECHCSMIPAATISIEINQQLKALL